MTCDALVPSTEEDGIPIDLTISDFRSIIQKIQLRKAEWVAKQFRGSSFFTSRGKWNALMEYCREHYHPKIDAVSMAEALLDSVNNFNRHDAILAKVNMESLESLSGNSLR